MLIDEIKKANMLALKEKNSDARAIYSVVITRVANLSYEFKAQNKELTDQDVIKIMQKILKELAEEKAGYCSVNNAKMVSSILNQENYLKAYLPQMLSEEEIKKIISSLDDKSVPNVMKYFKANYAGKVEMALVSKVLKEFN